MELLVDGRTLDDRHPGVRRFWLPVLRAWAKGAVGRACVAHRSGEAPEAELVALGFEPLALPCGPRHPLALRRQRRAVLASGARATLSPLYLTLDGAPRNLACVFDLIGREHARSPAARGAWALALRHVRRGASAVVVPSAATARALEGAFPDLAARTRIVPPVAPAPPVAAPAVLARLGVAPPYALAVASHRPHKGLAALARAWRARGATPPLVLVGAGTEALDARPAVCALGFVRDAELEALLAGAGCLVSASRAEGFGLPLLAALAAGVPIVATRLPAHEELAGAHAHWADTPAALVGCARALALGGARRADDAAAQRRRATAFSAERAAEALDRALRG